MRREAGMTLVEVMISAVVLSMVMLALSASLRTFATTYTAVEQSADHILLDYLLLPEISLPQTTLIKGDMRSLSIASASILAKVARDAEMVALDSEMPLYGFAKHKGYGTKAHREALEKHGASPQHRLSFAPLRNL